MAKELTFGWIMQPALLDLPQGVDPADIGLARKLIEANEQHVELARQAGFNTVWVEDHLMSWGDRAHLECYTNLAWLAGRHAGLWYGTMVSGQAFRNPGLLAKMAANLYLLTDGKFILGIGAGNNEQEHRAYGIEFLPPGERLEQTEEAIQIIRKLWTERPATFLGNHYRIEAAASLPLPDGPIPLMIGGGGEKKTLKLVARYADWWCADLEPVEVFAHKVGVLRAHCEAMGRDMGEITLGQVTWISVEERSEWATRWQGGPHIVAGDADEVTRELEGYRHAGAEHFMIRFMDYPSLAGMERFARKVMPRLA